MSHHCIVCDNNLDEHSLEELQICSLIKSLQKGKEVE